jgi:pimeloyl-ACP methyl ester carboxylesterase
MTLRTILPVAALALAVTPASSVSPPHHAARLAPPPRPVVLLVHGRGQAARDTTALRRELRDALRAGTRAVAGDAVLADGDVRLVWYADAVDPRSAEVASCAPVTARDADPADSPRAVLSVLATAAEAFLDVVEAPQTGDAAELRALAADVRWLGEPGTRCAAERRLGDALARARMEGRPVIVVAHSFGALVTWGRLAHDSARIERLVTVGSPLASAPVRELVFGRAGPLRPPPGVRSWVNVVGEGDGLAVPLAEADSAALPATMRDVQATSPGVGTHDFGDYLRDPATARAIVGAWCVAGPAASTPGCAALEPSAR